MNRALGIATALAAAVLGLAMPAVSVASESDSGSSVEWRVLGPAVSHHFAEKYAPQSAGATVASAPCLPAVQLQEGIPLSTLSAQGLPTTACPLTSPTNTTYTSYGVKCEPDRLVSWGPGGEPVVVRDSHGGSYINGGSAHVTSCQVLTMHRRPHWNQWNPSLGVERVTRDGDVTTGYFAGYAQDSYDRPSFMVGGSARLTLAEIGSVQVEAGLEGGLWYRTELHYNQVAVAKSPKPEQFSTGYQTGGWTYDTQLVKRLEPLIVPMLTIEDKPSGLGVRIAYAPAFKLFGQVVNAVPTIMIQTSYRL